MMVVSQSADVSKTVSTACGSERSTTPRGSSRPASTQAPRSRNSVKDSITLQAWTCLTQ